MSSEFHDIQHVDPFGSSVPDPGGAVCVIGVFDGMHLGHREIFAQARDRAEAAGKRLVALTFDVDPDEVFRRGDPSFGKLLSNDVRLRMIADQVADGVASLPVSQEVLAMSPEEFLEFLSTFMKPYAIYTGTNFRFGSHATGSADDLAQWADQHDCEYVACELVESDGDVVSSTRIRAELAEGHVAQAKQLLGGRPHSVTGVVVHGRGEGDGFGFATANLDLSACETMLPREGVYAGYGIVDGKRYPAAINVGVARSFEDATAQLEAHLLDFDGDLYDKEVAVEFEEWLREPRVFESQEELISTVTGNIEWVAQNMKVD